MLHKIIWTELVNDIHDQVVSKIGKTVIKQTNKLLEDELNFLYDEIRINISRELILKNLKNFESYLYVV